MIEQIKVIFARHGVPEEIMSDNGPQFASFKTSAEIMGLITSPVIVLCTHSLMEKQSVR